MAAMSLLVERCGCSGFGSPTKWEGVMSVLEAKYVVRVRPGSRASRTL